MLTLPSPVRPHLAQSLVGVASVESSGGFRRVSLVEGRPRFFGSNSAFRCADVLRSYGCLQVLDYVREHRLPLFYWFHDVVDSRWAFTVVARELQLTGASAVLSFLFGLPLVAPIIIYLFP